MASNLNRTVYIDIEGAEKESLLLLTALETIETKTIREPLRVRIMFPFRRHAIYALQDANQYLRQFSEKSMDPIGEIEYKYREYLQLGDAKARIVIEKNEK